MKHEQYIALEEQNHDFFKIVRSRIRTPFHMPSGGTGTNLYAWIHRLKKAPGADRLTIPKKKKERKKPINKKTK